MLAAARRLRSCRWQTVAVCYWERPCTARSSQIALRMVSREAIGESEWLKLL